MNMQSGAENDKKDKTCPKSCTKRPLWNQVASEKQATINMKQVLNIIRKPHRSRIHMVVITFSTKVTIFKTYSLNFLTTVLS